MTIASVRVPAALFVLTFLPHWALCLQGDQRRLVPPLLGRFLMLPPLVLGRPTSGRPRRHNQGGFPLQPDRPCSLSPPSRSHPLSSVDCLIY